jgi:hypothetical protein
MEQPLDMEWSTYSHAQFGNRSTAFMRQAVKAGKPFFAHIGTTGPHLPSEPAPWHAAEIASWTTNVTAPRTPDFDFLAHGSHPSLAALPSLNPHYGFVDQHHRDRLGTLLSIDDLVAGVVSTLDELKVLDNTYIIFSADQCADCLSALFAFSAAQLSFSGRFLCYLVIFLWSLSLLLSYLSLAAFSAAQLSFSGRILCCLVVFLCSLSLLLSCLCFLYGTALCASDSVFPQRVSPRQLAIAAREDVAV